MVLIRRLNIQLLLKSIMANHARFAIFLFAFIFIPFVEIRPVHGQVSAYDLINLINGMRSANGLGSLSVDSSLMACAQSTAETMAASNMTWHIGNVSGRASSFGYNNYNTCFATENFMMGGPNTTIAQIQASWSDATHMIPATSSSYCHIGAGVATASNGMIYYVVQAAYPAGVAGCGFITSTGSYAGSSGSGSGSGLIMSVMTATPDEDGYLFHTVEEGQTLWAISVAYDVTVEDLQSWNNMYNSTALSLGQKLYIPSTAEAGRTPTPQVALTVLPTADSAGRFYHIVSEGDTLWSISELWKVSLNLLYQANNMNADSSIGLGWEIAIPVTATVTPLPTDTPTPLPVPSETPLPTDTLPVSAEAISTPTSSSSSTGIFHTPKASSRTYIYSGIILLILTGGGIIGISSYWKKK